MTTSRTLSLAITLCGALISVSAAAAEPQALAQGSVEANEADAAFLKGGVLPNLAPKAGTHFNADGSTSRVSGAMSYPERGISQTIVNSGVQHDPEAPALEMKQFRSGESRGKVTLVTDRTVLGTSRDEVFTSGLADRDVPGREIEHLAIFRDGTLVRRDVQLSKDGTVTTQIERRIGVPVKPIWLYSLAHPTQTVVSRSLVVEKDGVVLRHVEIGPDARYIEHTTAPGHDGRVATRTVVRAGVSLQKLRLDQPIKEGRVVEDMTRVTKDGVVVREDHRVRNGERTPLLKRVAAYFRTPAPSVAEHHNATAAASHQHASSHAVTRAEGPRPTAGRH
jgi:hypothetical protein